jgi:hypothetical protein
MKGAPIKPGTVCMIVGMRSPFDVNNGAMVTAVKKILFDAWSVKNHSRTIYIREFSGSATMKPCIDGDAGIYERFLLPISDPDADVTERDEQHLTV